MYIDKLGGRVKKYNKKYHTTFKISMLMQIQVNILILIEKVIRKILNLKLVIMLEYQNVTALLQKVTFQIGYDKFL